jgi:transcriptional regulator with XRE-family HTH domain
MKKYAEIGNRLEILRGRVTQADTSKRLGIALLTYQRYESGERIPKGDVLQRIAEAYGETTDYILTGKRPVTLLDVALHKILPPESKAKLNEFLAGLRSTVQEIEAERSAEQYGLYGFDDVTLKILDMLKGMDVDQKRDALRFIEGQKLLADREKKLKEGTSNE